MNDTHDLVLLVKELALELGRTPLKAEFVKVVKGGSYKIDKFGGYTALLMAAGFETHLERKAQKITNSVFEKDIEEHLSSYQPKLVHNIEPLPTLASISDVHWPFENKKVITSFQEYVGDTKPEYIILNGDAWDMYSHSKFPRSHNVFTPREEQEFARKGNEEFWTKIKSMSPKSKCIQMMGNHDIRPLKRILESYPEAEDWIADKLKSLFTFDGVKTIHDAREEFIIANIAIFHGYRSQLGNHRDYTLMNTINGHTHKGGVVFRRIRGQTLWELNSGLAGDPEAKGLTYTPQKITDWTPGFGIINRYGPQFISL